MRFFTPREAGMMIRREPSTVRLMIAAGRLLATKAGGRWLIDEREILRFVGDESNHVGQDADRAGAAGEAGYRTE